MKRVMLAVLTILSAAMLLIAAPTTAQEDTSASVQAGVPQMARYYPDDTFLFAAMRLDSNYVDQLNTVLAAVSNSLSSLAIPQIDLRGALSMVTGGSDVFSWLGDYAAFGYSGDVNALFDISSAGTTSPGALPAGVRAYGVIELRDAAAAETFLASILPRRDYQTPVDSEYPSFATSDGTSIVITPTAAYVLPPGTPFLYTRVDAAPTFDSNTTFTAVTGHLPAPGYNAIVYTDAAVFVQLMQAGATIASTSQSFKQPAQQSNMPSIPTALGLTILNGDTLTIDVATMGGAAPADAIDPDFMRFVPANTGAVIHATNLTSLFDNAVFPGLNSLAQVNGGTNETPIEEQAQTLFQMIGLDLRQDVLSWTTGDYALFARADLVEIARRVIANKIDANGLYDFGLIMEATDPALAAAFTSRITDLLAQAASGTPSDQLVISQRTFGETEATVFELHIPSDQFFGPTTEAETIVLPIAIGANEEVFFIATADAAEAMFGGDGGSLADQAAYQDAQTYVLPNPTSVWYTSGEGFLVSVVNPFAVVGGLALMGPTVGNIFDNIVMELDGTPTLLPTLTPTPTPVPTLNAAQIDQQVAPIVALNALIRSSTISSTITDDSVTLIRLTLSLNLGE